MDIKNLLSYIFYFKIKDPNYFNWQCTKSWQIRLFHAIYINWQGFKRTITKHPHASKAWLSLNILGLKLNFRIGLQHHTWLRIRNEELYSLWVKFHNWYNWPPF